MKNKVCSLCGYKLMRVTEGCDGVGRHLCYHCGVSDTLLKIIDRAEPMYMKLPMLTRALKSALHQLDGYTDIDITVVIDGVEIGHLDDVLLNKITMGTDYTLWYSGMPLDSTYEFDIRGNQLIIYLLTKGIYLSDFNPVGI